MKLEFTDRYDALGIKRPNHLTMCRGDCEGVGVYPIRVDELRARGRDIPDLAPGEDEDGWRFVTCEVCQGTGKQTGRFVALRRFPGVAWKNARFIARELFHPEHKPPDESRMSWMRRVITIGLTTW